MSRTLYETIGVSFNADVKEIEQKCIDLGKKYHPKTNPDDLDAAIIYKDVMVAYSTLRDPAKRAAYDASIRNLNTPIKTTTQAPFKPLASNQTKEREVGVWLAGSIIAVPPIFAWFLLRKGYSTKLRLAAFVWMAIWLGFYNSGGSEKYNEYKQESEQQKVADKKAEQDSANSDKGLQNRIMGAWKSGIKDALIDPNSAEFKNVYFVLAANRVSFACGEVNSKNRLGGYTGYKRFITAGLKEYTFIEGEKEGFNEYWKQVCVEGMKY